MPGITYLWIMFHLTKLWSYILYYCKMSSCFSIAHQTEWGGVLSCMFSMAFSQQTTDLSCSVPHSLPGWLTFRLEWRQREERKSKKGFSPKRDRESFLYPPKAWPGQRHLKSKWLKLPCHPNGESNRFLLCRQDAFKMATGVSFHCHPINSGRCRNLQATFNLP